MQQLTSICSQQDSHRVDFIPVSLLRDFSDLDVPDPAQPAKGGPVYIPDRFKRKLIGVFSFKCENDRCDFFEPRYLPIDMKHFGLEKGGTKNRDTR